MADISSISWSPDGTKLASYSSSNKDTTICIRDNKGTLLKVIRGHKDRVYLLSWSPESSILASVSHDRTVRFWDTETGHLIKEITLQAVQLTSDSFAHCSVTNIQWNSAQVKVTGENMQPVTITIADPKVSGSPKQVNEKAAETVTKPHYISKWFGLRALGVLCIPATLIIALALSGKFT